MEVPRLQILSAVFVLLLAAARCTAGALFGGSGPRADGRPEPRGVRDSLGRFSKETTTGLHGARTPDRRSRSSPGLEVHVRDPRHKEKFIKHLTGPLYFHPKCRRHFHRLYHDTRDCTMPAYYRRCARLLTRLANSPRCSDT